MRLFKRHIKWDYILVLLLVTTVLSSCLKDVDTFTPYEGVEYNADPNESGLFAGNIIDFFNELAKEETSYTINNNEGGELILPSNNRMSFPPNSFSQYEQDNPVEGEIEIVIKEIHSKGDRVLNDKPTVAENDLLISGGEFMVKAFKEGEELFFLEGKSATISKETDVDQGIMNIFWGEETSGNDINWIEANLPPVTANFSSFGEDLSYEFDIDQLGWISLDKYFDTNSPTSLDVKVPFGFKDKNMAVFMIFKNEMSVVRLSYDLERDLFSTGSYKIPSGEEVTIVGIAELEGLYEYGAIETFTGETLSVSILMERKTFTEIQMALSAF